MVLHQLQLQVGHAPTGPYTVILKTKSPWAPTASDLALFANSIFPANFGGQSAAQFFQHPIGTGPFKLSKWVKGQSVQLVRNPHYWEPGKPYLNGVTYNYVPDSNTRIIQLKGGQAQVVEFVPYSLVSSVPRGRLQRDAVPVHPGQLLLAEPPVQAARGPQRPAGDQPGHEPGTDQQVAVRQHRHGRDARRCRRPCSTRCRRRRS